ncbi:Glycyl-tRNA synthetase beta chain [Roseibacterium elongatum DSM 19469]|uniref:glycine--tRNA ligase n=1 Tax=Roseicyclus elongatus DSM 19469 TaxID=1294273 RepID=W8S9I8_9RHOB|nr:Glycyl-tRNA synthetase beta chain [Roseibacterium elongatum DSM 19469]
MPDLLLELFSEEIPARMQARAAEDLKRLVTDGLVEAGLTYAGAGAFSTPRRLVLALEGLTPESPTKREERRGPRTDAPEKALEGFLRSTGLGKDQLEAREEKKGSFWFATIETPGRPAAEIVAEVVTRTVRNFPWPKSMRVGGRVTAVGAPAALDPVHPERRARAKPRCLRYRRDRGGRHDRGAPLHGAGPFCRVVLR